MKSHATALASHRDGLDAFWFAGDAWQRTQKEFVMAQVGNSEDRIGGEFMVQDCDHVSENRPVASKAGRNGARQSDQSQKNGRQQGGVDRSNGRQQGDARRNGAERDSD